MAHNSKPDSESMDKIADPLGVIEHCAKRMWEQQGKPPGTTWRDHVGAAEELLLSGRSSGTPACHTPHTETPAPIPPTIWALRDQSRDVFAAALARSINTLLNEHESYCLAVFLLWNEIRIVGGEAPVRCTEAKIAELLAAFSAQYDEDFVRRSGEGRLENSSLEKRAEYWNRKIFKWKEDDEPLTYSDRNTIDRLKDALCRQPEIESTRLHE